MNEKVKRFVKAFTELSMFDREAIKNFINDYENKNGTEKDIVKSNLSLGPISSNTCPICGK